MARKVVGFEWETMEYTLFCDGKRTVMQDDINRMWSNVQKSYFNPWNTSLNFINETSFKPTLDAINVWTTSSNFTSPIIYTEWSKCYATHSWHVFYLSKSKLHRKQKTKTMLYLSVGNVHRIERCMHSLFSSCLMQPSEEFLQWRLKCTAQYFVVLKSEHSLHLWKRHPCTSTVWRQLTDWRKQVTTWRDLHGLLYSHGNIVFI
jgi:hypothetical protein